MKTTVFSGVMANAYGKPLSELATKSGVAIVGTLSYETSFQEIESKDEIPAAEVATDEDLVDLANNKRKAAARQKAMQVTLDAAEVIKPTQENDGQLRLRAMYKTLKAAGKSHEKARETAAMVLETEWADDYSG